jgi:ABC-type Fe3+-siderophore transport system permease subunit
VIPDSQLSLSNALFLTLVASIGVILYIGFAYLVVRSKNIETKRRWRYSILSGVCFGASLSILFGIGSVFFVLFGDENGLGYMTIFRSLRSPLDFLKGILFFLTYPVLISLPFVFLVTFDTYWKQLRMGDMFINQLLYPSIRHPSDRSPDGLFDRVRAFITKLIDG